MPGESYCRLYVTSEDVPLVEFMYLVFTHVPDETYHRLYVPLRMYPKWSLCTLYLHACQVGGYCRRLRSLNLCDVFQVLSI